MTDGIIVASSFIFSFALHIIIHRILSNRGIVTIKTIGAYTAGLGILVVSYVNNLLLLPLSSFVSYVFVSFVTSVFYLGICLPGETPAAIILHAFTRKKTRTLTELTRLFTTRGLLWNRIDQLLSAGLIKRREDRYMVTPIGGYIAACLSLYQKFFNRPLGG